MDKIKSIDFKKSVLIPGAILFFILFLLNGISRNWFFRLDLTDNNMYSLSTSSKSVVEQVDDLLTMKIYFSDDLPSYEANNRRFLQDILEEYVAFSDGNIRFEFFRPEDDQNIKEEAQKAGIRQHQIQDVENDKLVVRNVLMGMVILYEDKKEVFPVIQTTTGLEYEITTRIKKLIETNKPIVGIAQIEGQDGQSQNIQNVLRDRYNVRSVSLADEVPSDISVILMSGIADSLTSDENENLKGYLNRGGNLFLAQNRVKTNLQFQQAFVIQSDIFSLIEPFGLNISENLVTDRICGRVSVQQQVGPIRVNVPMEYPLLPIVQNFNADEAIVAGLEQIQLVFASEIQPDSTEDDQVNFVPLLFTSEQSGEMRGNFNLSPDPQQNPFLRLFNQSGKILGARSERVDENGIISQVVLVGDSDFLLDQGGGMSRENHIFVMNSVDYLIGDRDLIALRSREITSRPLKKVDDAPKYYWKGFNYTLTSILIILFGLICGRWRKIRRDMLEEIYG